MTISNDDLVKIKDYAREMVDLTKGDPLPICTTISSQADSIYRKAATELVKRGVIRV